MATREQLIGALRKADAAGDTVAAQRFAELIKAQPMQQKTAPKSNQDLEIKDLPEFNTVDGNEALFGSQFGGEGGGFGQTLRDAGAALVTFNPQARIDGIKKRFPDLEIEPFGNGNAIIKNPANGGVTILNQEGLSMADLSPFLGALVPGTAMSKPILATKGVNKIAAGAATSAATDAAFQGAEMLQGSEQGFDSTRLATSAVLGGAFAPLPGIVGDKFNQVKASKFIRDAAPKVEALKQKAGAIYQQLDEAGVVFKPDFIKNISAKIMATAKKEGFRERIHPKVAGALEDFTPENISQKSLADLLESRTVMQQAAASNEPAERRLASILIEQIDEAIDSTTSLNVLAGDVKNLGPMLSEARALWHSAKKSDKLAQLMELSKNARSGEENGLRQEFSRIAKRITTGKERGWTAEEKALMQRVADGTTPSNIIKLMGKFGAIDTNNPKALMPLLGIGAGASVGGPVGAVLVPVVGQVSRNTALKLTQNNARLADAVVRMGKDGKRMAVEYMRLVPRKEWDAQELSEILLARGAGADTLKIMAEKGSKPAKELAQQVRKLMLTTGATVAATPLAAEEISD